MTMHTTQMIYDNLGNTLLEVNKQIDAVKKDTLNRQSLNGDADQELVYHTRYSSGEYVLNNLLLAKAQCLSAMAGLKSADIISRTPQPRRR